MVILGLRVGISFGRLARRFGRLEQAEDASLLGLLSECRRRLGVRGEVRMVESAGVSTPVLFGCWSPKLVLPAGIGARFSMGELRFIFLHELAHVKRRDLAMNWLMTLLQVVHWFNPLIWWGFARCRADRELACDALALDAADPEQNREYGRTILHLLENMSAKVSAPGLIGILEDQRQLRRRLRMIASYRPARRWGFWSMLLLAGLAVVCLTDAQSSKQSYSTGAAGAKPASEAKPEAGAGEVLRGIMLFNARSASSSR